MSVTDTISTLGGELDSALAAGDNSSAMTLALRIQALIASQPEEEQVGDTMRRWNARSISELISSIRGQINRSFGGIRTQKIKYVSPDCSE